MPLKYNKSSNKHKRSKNKRSKKKSKKKSNKKEFLNIDFINDEQKKIFIKNNENNGMMTSIWGPSAWFFLHIITFNYPITPTDEDKKNYYNFFYNLQYVLPCGKCRINYKNNIYEEDTELTLNVFDNRESVKMWLYKLHNKVNKLTGKSINITYDDMNKKFEQYRAICNNNDKNHVGCNIAQYENYKNKKCEIKIVEKKK